MGSPLCLPACLPSPAPPDWGSLIDVVGFCFLDLASKYEPPADLLEWLARGNGQAPIFVGFGSLVSDVLITCRTALHCPVPYPRVVCLVCSACTASATVAPPQTVLCCALCHGEQGG